MSKYSEKKERQAKEALAAEQAEREAARAKAKEQEQKKPEKPTTPEKPTMRAEAIKERMKLASTMIAALGTANDAIDECIIGTAEMKDETQSEERGFYYAAFGRLVAARDKVLGAINSLNLASAAAKLTEANP